MYILAVSCSWLTRNSNSVATAGPTELNAPNCDFQVRGRKRAVSPQAPIVLRPRWLCRRKFRVTFSGSMVEFSVEMQHRADGHER